MASRFDAVRMYYSTAHYNGTLFAGPFSGDVLDDLGATIKCPPTEAEKRNPRKEDRFLTQTLITHLNRNIEYYNRVLRSSMDSQRRFLLFDGFKIETFVSLPLCRTLLPSICREGYCVKGFCGRLTDSRCHLGQVRSARGLPLGVFCRYLACC
jgi:hypothetical protein